MYLVIPTSEVEQAVMSGEWQRANLTGREAADQIRAAADPEKLWVMTIDARSTTLVALMRADKFLRATPVEALFGMEPGTDPYKYPR